VAESRYSTISPGEEECCSCGMAGVLLHKIPPSEFASGQEHRHCDLCHESMAGQACEFPRNYPAIERNLMRHVCQVANVLLKELRKNEGPK
jgi:hypothetical protein